jgi:hypothetical protein
MPLSSLPMASDHVVAACELAQESTAIATGTTAPAATDTFTSNDQS